MRIVKIIIGAIMAIAALMILYDLIMCLGGVYPRLGPMR